MIKKDNPVETMDNLFRQLLSGSENRDALLASNLLTDPKRGDPTKR
ncbi:MAG: hypothetical protein GXO70_11270 [Acidobacteria bacterium]|nr:hypothetical protein [Acidobacteriota bacterium]